MLPSAVTSDGVKTIPNAMKTSCKLQKKIIDIPFLHFDIPEFYMNIWTFGKLTVRTVIGIATMLSSDSVK